MAPALPVQRLGGVRSPPTNRGHSLRCRAEAPLPSDGSMRQMTKAQMLAKIAAAKEYKAKGAEAPPAAPPLPPPGPKDSTLAALDAYAARQAEDEAAQFLEAQQQIAASRPPPAVHPPPPPPPPPAAAPPSPEQPPESPPAANDRAFRRGGGTADQAANWLQTIATQGLASGLDAQSLRPEEFTARKEEAQRARGADIERAKSAVVGTRRRFDGDVDDYGLAQMQDDAELAMAAERGAVEAAKAAARGAEIAAVEGAPAPAPPVPPTQQEGQESEEDLHKPKVATWGVFPRPRNISEAYGGGRNLPPGQRLESEDAAAEREQRVSAALSSYRKSMGLDIDPEVEARARALFEEGQALFAAGAISGALDKFSAAAALVPLRTKIGGQAYLQKALCLDSLGRNEEAYTIYKSLEGHTGPGVAKAARRFLFGFKAAKKLKVDTIYYGSGGVEAWQGYFDRINSGAWTAYVPKSEEAEGDEGSARAAAVAAAAVVLVPLGLVAAVIAAR